MPFKSLRTMSVVSMTYTRYQQLRSQNLKLHFLSGTMGRTSGQCASGAPRSAVHAESRAMGRHCSGPAYLGCSFFFWPPTCSYYWICHWNSGRVESESLLGYSRAVKPVSSHWLQLDLPSNEACKYLCLWNFHILMLTGLCLAKKCRIEVIPITAPALWTRE